LQRRAPISRWLKIQKAHIEYLFEHDEVIKYTLDGVSTHPVTTKIQASFLTQLRRGRKPLRDFTRRPMMTLKQLQSLMAVIGEN
jgi:hypothetical protein